MFCTTLYVDDGASIIFNGFAIIAEGTSIRADYLSVIEFGDNFYCNKNCILGALIELNLEIIIY